MENIPVELHLLRSLKGPGLSVLIALWLVGTPQNMRWLQRTTGYGDEAVQGALELLAEYSLVTRCGRYSWQFASGAKQLPLAMQLPGQAAADSIDDPSSNGAGGATPSESGRPDGTPEIPESHRGKRVVFAGTPEKPESDPGKNGVPHSSSSGLIDLKLLPEVKPLPRVADTGISGVPPQELLAILDEHGIREPARSRLAAMAHATPRLLRYHLRTAPTPALAIYRIGANWRVPREWDFFMPPEPDEVEEPEEAEEPDEAEKLFRGALAVLKMCAGASEYAALAKLRARAFDGTVLTLEAENQAEADAARRVERSLLAAMGRKVEVEFALTPALSHSCGAGEGEEKRFARKQFS